MKTLKEVTEELKIEIKSKKNDLALLKSDHIMRNLRPEDLTTFYNINNATGYEYLNVYPRIPLRHKNTSKLMSKCIGNTAKLNNSKILERKKLAVKYFTEKWMEMRKDYELLKNIL